MSLLRDLTGQRFGRLIVLAYAYRKPTTRKIRWHCLCDCGTAYIANGNDLHTGNTRSCGCLKREHLGTRARTHGRSNTREYRIWSCMIQRCSNPHNNEYHRYGARGIRVDERWLDFTHFYHDMGPRPSQRHSLGRKNNDGPYCKENCEWQTAKQQGRNTRNNRMLTYQGETRCLAEWAEHVSLPTSTIAYRLKHGWSVADALETPLRTLRLYTPITFEGKTLPLKDWAPVVGIHHKTLYDRFRHGWSVELLLTTPVKRRGKTLNCLPEPVLL